MAGQQSARVELADGSRVLTFCANNYLGLANDARLIEAAKQGLDAAGFGLASVRFICGTQTGHKALAHSLASFLKMDDAILYRSEARGDRNEWASTVKFGGTRYQIK